MITLTTPVPVMGETNTELSLATARIDLLNNSMEFVEVYGSGTPFAPSRYLPGQPISVDLTSGQIRVNGILLKTGAVPTVLSAAQLTSIQGVVSAFQKAVETEFVALNIFTGATT